MSNLEGQMALWLDATYPKLWSQEYRFHPKRKWRFDFALPGRKVAIEIEGLTASGGRHQSIKGFSNDCEKYNRAAIMGWTVLRFTQKHLRDGSAYTMIQEAMDG